MHQLAQPAKFCNLPFRELVCQGMAPSMLHILSELSTMSTDQEIKDLILGNYIPNTAEAAARLQNMQMPPNEPLVSFNSRYEAID